MLLFILLSQIQLITHSPHYLFSSSISSPTITTNNSAHNKQAFPIYRQATPRISFNEKISFDLGAINRAQQAYYFERAEFANNYQELGLYQLEDEDNYQLTIHSKDNLAFAYAIPQENYATYKRWSSLSWKDAKEPLYSYVSAIAYSKDKNIFQSILCVSTTIGDEPKAPLRDRELEEPKISEGKFVCSPGTEEIL